MNERSPFTLTAFVADAADRLKVKTCHIANLLQVLSASERPDSFRVLFWLLLQTLQNDAELHASIVEDWMPSETDLAQLLEDAGKEETKTVLAMVGDGYLDRLWRLSDDAGILNLVKSSNPDPWEVAALAPMAALVAERQLDELIAAVVREYQWKDPAEILSLDEHKEEFEIVALICLAQARMVEGGWGEALDIAMLRLLEHADQVN